MLLQLPLIIADYAPNDAKLSDCGARRAGCRVSDTEDARERKRVSRKRRVERKTAASVTRGAVRCTAWFGVRSFGSYSDLGCECGGANLAVERLDRCLNTRVALLPLQGGEGEGSKPRVGGWNWVGYEPVSDEQAVATILGWFGVANESQPVGKTLNAVRRLTQAGKNFGSADGRDRGWCLESSNG
jgi:hypothetical protein